MNLIKAAAGGTVLALAWASPAAGQGDTRSFAVGIQVASAVSSQFDAADAGLGGRIAWHPTGLLGVEAELNFYPREFPEGRPFSRTRVEALFGLTAGPTFDRVRPFGRLRSGLVDIHESSEPFACILIYPPPLACTLASGRTLFALDVGGGADITVTSRIFLRVDLGDRMVRYPGPAFVNDPRRIRERPFFGHDFRFATGAGLRF